VLENLAAKFQKSTTKLISTDFTGLVVEDEDTMASVTKLDQEMKRMLNWDASPCLSRLVNVLRSKRVDGDGIWEGSFVAGGVGVLQGLAVFLTDILEKDSRVEGRGARFCAVGKVCGGVQEFMRWVVQVCESFYF
jgi:hypothetical protein